MANKIGSGTFIFENPSSIMGYGAVVGKKEGQGPFAKYFDYISDDSRFGEKSFEKAESKMQKVAIAYALKKAGLSANQIDAVCAGDLLNQCIGSSFGIKDFSIPFIGVYGACSTMALSSIIISCLIESKVIEKGIAVTSSHFCSAERQYRFPLEYGSQRTPNSQWTVTGSGALLLGTEGNGPKITAATFGKIEDLKIKDQNNMGAAMAPAACSTIIRYLRDTNTCADDYDMIFTGDLGVVGSDLLRQLCEREGVDLKDKHNDFGKMIFDISSQDVHAGASGCGCSASMLCSYVMSAFREKKYKNILFCATGALLSPTSVMQGESIPTVAHLIRIEA